MSPKEAANTNLALLSVLSGVIMSTLYADGAFEYWDMLPGFFVAVTLLAYWDHVGQGIFVDLSMAVMGGAAVLMLSGVWLEPRFVGQEPFLPARTVLELQTASLEMSQWQTSRNDTLAIAWASFAALVFGLRVFVRMARK